MLYIKDMRRNKSYDKYCLQLEVIVTQAVRPSQETSRELYIKTDPDRIYAKHMVRFLRLDTSTDIFERNLVFGKFWDVTSPANHLINYGMIK